MKTAPAPACPLKWRQFMGASAANISVSGSSINKGETLLDTAITIDHMATDFVIMSSDIRRSTIWPTV